MRIDGSAPTRIDLAGGTLDIWPIYLFHQPAVTVNAAISLRAHCRLESRADQRVVLVSEDTGERVDAARLEELGVDRLPILARLARHFGVRGLTITTRSDSPVGAGIAGSSAMVIALIAALGAWRSGGESPAIGDGHRDVTRDAAQNDELLALAMNIEAQVINVPTGVQDYRPALYGGVSAVELDVTGVHRVALDVDPRELGSRLVLAYTGATRNSGINNWDVMKRHIDGDAAVIEAFAKIASIAGDMRRALERHDWTAVGDALGAEWENRRRFAPGVTTPAIDALLAAARRAGAVAGKVCGAGGGGCLICLVDPARRDDVALALAAGGATVLPFSVERDGVRLTTRAVSTSL